MVYLYLAPFLAQGQATENMYFISDVKSGWTKQEAISMLFVVKISGWVY